MKKLIGAAMFSLAMLFLADAVQAANDKSSIGTAGTMPENGRPLKKVRFPPIAHWNTLKIALTRSQCYGACPSYRVEISAHGTVRYEGKYAVAVTGKQEAHIPVRSVHALYEAFVKADFFWTFDEYRASIADLPTQEVTISFDGHSKRVIDYVGRAIGMPKEIGELEKAIDETAETKKWVKG